MIIRLIAIFFIMSIVLTAQSANDNEPVGARSNAMGNASVTFIDLWSLHNNQAGLGFMEKPEAGLFFENRFMMTEIGYMGVAFAYPVKESGTLGLNFSRFGNALYNDNKIGLAYGKSFGKRISAGIQLDYFHTRIAENYGSSGAVAVEGGVIAEVIKDFKIGFHIFNVNQAKIASYNDERIPSIMRLGMAYTLPGKAVFAAEVHKQIDRKPTFSAGLEYHVIKQLYLRAGMSSNPQKATFGFGLELDKFKIDFSSSMHSVLGLTPGMSLSYVF